MREDNQKAWREARTNVPRNQLTQLKLHVSRPSIDTALQPTYRSRNSYGLDSTSAPLPTMSSHRLFRFPKPTWLNSANTRTGGVYAAGALVSEDMPFDRLQQTADRYMQFSLGFYFFIDAAAFSHSARNGADVHITFVDWIPGMCSALGMLVINSIDKARLSADTFSYSGNGVAWKARLVLFLGFALMAGGLAGSVVSA